ncbi:unnamed protein product [Absidia cylindrospora]
MLGLIKAFFVCQSIKELYVKEHILFLLVLLGIHTLFNSIYLGFVFNYLPIWLTVRVFTGYCLYVIVTNLGIPFIDHFIGLPVYTPLANSISGYIHAVFNKSSKKGTTISPTTPITAPTTSMRLSTANQTNDRPLTMDPKSSETTIPTTTLFRTFGQPDTRYQSSVRLHPTDAAERNRIYSGLNRSIITSDMNDKPVVASHQDYPSYDLKRMLEESERLDLEARQQTRLAPSLSFAPSIQPPRPPAKRMDKTLWQLSRTSKMEDDFREEQVALMNEHWEKVVTSDLQYLYRDRLTKWLASKVFHPLAASITQVNQQIHPHIMANCPENIMASILHFEPKLIILKEAIYLPGYSDSVENRQYVSERIKDLGSCDSLQSFHWTKQNKDLPGDDIILMHAFKTYMKYEMPNVVPPLIPEEGGVFLFLLVFFFITEELKDDIFHL